MNAIGIKKEVMIHLTCPICCELFSDPVVTPCGHSFCKNCLDTWIVQNRRCPYCKNDLFRQAVQYVGNRTLRTFLANIKFRCEKFLQCCTSKFGEDQISCGWVGNREELCKHLENECLLKNVKCPNQGCNLMFTEKSLASHLSICIFNTSEPRCEECGYYLDNHEEIYCYKSDITYLIQHYPIRMLEDLNPEHYPGLSAHLTYVNEDRMDSEFAKGLFDEEYMNLFEESKAIRSKTKSQRNY